MNKNTKYVNRNECILFSCKIQPINRNILGKSYEPLSERGEQSALSFSPQFAQNLPITIFEILLSRRFPSRSLSCCLDKTPQCKHPVKPRKCKIQPINRNILGKSYEPLSERGEQSALSFSPQFAQNLPITIFEILLSRRFPSRSLSCCLDKTPQCKHPVKPRKCKIQPINRNILGKSYEPLSERGEQSALSFSPQFAQNLPITIFEILLSRRFPSRSLSCCLDKTPQCKHPVKPRKCKIQPINRNILGKSYEPLSERGEQSALSFSPQFAQNLPITIFEILLSRRFPSRSLSCCLDKTPQCKHPVKPRKCNPEGLDFATEN